MWLGVARLERDKAEWQGDVVPMQVNPSLRILLSSATCDITAIMVSFRMTTIDVLIKAPL